MTKYELRRRLELYDIILKTMICSRKTELDRYWKVFELKQDVKIALRRIALNMIDDEDGLIQRVVNLDYRAELKQYDRF